MAKKRIKQAKYNRWTQVVTVMYDDGSWGEIKDVPEPKLSLDTVKGLTLSQAKIHLGVK